MEGSNLKTTEPLVGSGRLLQLSEFFVSLVNGTDSDSSVTFLEAETAEAAGGAEAAGATAATAATAATVPEVVSELPMRYSMEKGFDIGRDARISFQQR